jgi:antitoxin component of RelBE/YafQ-DinJ toxin-antitoxin module
MTTQVIFKLDKKLKDQAMKKAQSEGVALSSVLKMATKAFVAGDLNVGLVTEERFNAKTRKEMDRIMKDIKAGKNLSPKFSNVDNAFAWLNSHGKNKKSWS